MKSSDVRESFLKYFEKNAHTRVSSSRLIPDGDPTILFTNAGMNQFKNTFLGLESRDYTRATTSQKCVRAGGKHNDLENVGFTARHHTFFEMLGNFSFGDYFKKDAIHFGWEWVTKTLALPKDRLYVSVFETDDEAAEIWHKQEGVPKDRIFRFGEKDNFWRMGNSGPCGPCSELFFDLDPDGEGTPMQNIADGTDRVIEFWNLVFMQFNETEDGKKTPLPKPSVDTGAGLERISTIMQGKRNNYDNDLFQSIIARAAKESQQEYISDISKIKNATEKKQADEINVAMRVLADHARATSFLIADGVMPSNDGRGYVLRRIMRRALRYGRKLAEDKSLMPSVIEEVIIQMNSAYPELKKQQSLILTTAKDEEKRFFATLDQGTDLLQNELKRLTAEKSQTINGEFAFKLYDTFGFPVDLTRLMAKESGFTVDESGFESHFQAAREKAKASWKGKSMSASDAHIIPFTQAIGKKSGATKFSGYNGGVKTQGKILALSDGQKNVDKLTNEQTGILVTDETCFYAESGGQVGDRGRIQTSTGAAEVLDTTKVNELHLHHIRVVDGQINWNDTAELQVEHNLRQSTANNHSATHLLHSALRKVLGTHVTQAGSLVGPDKLRFDFTHNKSLSKDELQQIEFLVNREISATNTVQTSVMTPDAAIKAGALALFGEKYGDKVRVLKMGEFSTELCGGTHVNNTAEIRVFKIVSEGGVSSGVRRIEAITGEAAVHYLFKHTRENMDARTVTGLQESWTAYLESQNTMAAWAEKSKEEVKTLQKEVMQLKGAQINVDELIQGAKTFNSKAGSARLVFARLDMDDRNLLSQISDKLIQKLNPGVVVLVGKGDPTHPIIVSVHKDLTGQFPANKILSEITSVMGGKGGGRPDFSQGAGQDLNKANDAKAQLQTFLGIN
jgi:alanyl-tRNA synthetase